MQPIESAIDVHGEAFAKNRAYMEGYVAKVRKVEQNQLATELGYKSRARDKGKLLPRERLARLLDP